MDLSPTHSINWEDEEEEPLFADDVINSDEEDPPPLPPPMPALSQLTQLHPATTPHTPATVRGRGVGGGGGGGGGWGDLSNTQGPSAAGGEGGAADQGSGDEKKRAPILTLTIDRIFSEKGLSRIEKEFPKLKFKGKGHEVGDLCYLMQEYEHWANALYPKLTFKDVTDRIEKLATKKEFKSELIQMRRRWARGATPPIPDDNDSDDVTNNDHRDNNSSHRGNSPTNNEIEQTSDKDATEERPMASDNEGDYAL